MGNSSHSAVVTICNIKGLHARATARFVKTVEAHDAQVKVTRLHSDPAEYDEERDGPVGGASMLGLMMLAAEKGAQLKLEASGREGAECLGKLVELVEQKFGED